MTTVFCINNTVALFIDFIMSLIDGQHSGVSTGLANMEYCFREKLKVKA